MKITITIESADIKEAARTLQGLSNRLDTMAVTSEENPPKTIVEPKKQVKHTEILLTEEPTAEQIGGNGEDGPLETSEKPEEPLQKRETDPNKPWTKKFPNGCRECGSHERKPMGKSLCTSCYFKFRDKYS